jgi:hypothetical protein
MRWLAVGDRRRLEAVAHADAAARSWKIGRRGKADLHPARAMPIVRMHKPNGPFWWAKMCSMAARTLERPALPRRMWGGIGRPSLCGNSLTPPRSIGVTRSAPRLADAVRSRCFAVDQLGIAPNRLRMPTREIIRLML